ncbi:MAG: calcium-binding protein, partial [Planctomycetota bacterium]
MSRYADERKRPRMIERLETRRLLSSAIDPVLDHAMWEPRVTPLLPATWTARTPSALDLTQPVTLGQTSNRRVVPNVNFNEAAAIRFDLEVLTATAGDFLVVTRGSGTNARILAEIDLDLAADGTQWAAIPNELAFGQDDVVFEIRSGNEQPASTIRLSNLSTAGDLAGVDGDRRQELLAGLDALPELFRAVNERPEFDVALPVSAGTARELIDIEGTLENFLISPIRTYLTSEANPTVDGLVAGLSDGSLIGAPSDAQVNLFASAAEDEDQFELRVELFYSTTVFEQLDLGDAARDSGLLSNSGEIETDITIRAQLDIGLAITDGLALPGSFRVVLEEIETEAVATRLESGSSLQVGAFEGVVNETAFNPFSFRTVVVPTSMEAVAIDSLEQLTGDDFFPQVRDADVGVNLIFTLSTIDVSRSLFLSTPDAFTQPFGPSSSGEQVLAVFNRLSVDEIADALLGLRDWLDGLSSASALDVSLPFVESDRLGELLDWGGVFEETFVDPLVNEDGSAKFSSITDLVDRVGTNVSEVYDEGSDTLEFRFQFDNENAELFSGLPADFDFSLGKLDRIQASSLIRIEPSVNGRLRVGFDLSDDIGTEQITPGTLLTDLNNGSGIAAPADRREFLIVTSDAARIPVRLGTVNVLGDVLSAIDSAPGANGRLAVSVDSEVGNLVVTDLTTGNATFSIVGTGGSFAAAGLGLAGQPAELDDQARPVIRGASLRGDGAIARSYVVGDAGSQLGSSIVIEDDGPLVLDATLGLVDISVSSGLLNATAFAELNIAEPGLPGGRIPLGQLLDGTSGVEENLNTGGNGFVVLPISETIDGVIGSPQITVNWSDSDLATGDSGNNDPTASASVSYNSDASPLEGLAQLTTADIFASARGAAQAVLQGPFGLDVDVPVVDATLGELTGIAAAFEDFERRLAQLEAQNRDDWTFATLATAIADSLSVVDTAVATVRFNQNQSALGSSRGLRFDLDFNDTSSISESVSVATAAGDIRDVASAAPLTGTSTVAGQITFGTTNGLPVIGDASRIDFVIEARNESLAIPANLGAAGILIQPAPGEQSFAVFDADGLPGGAGATLDYVLQDRFGFDFYELGDPSSLPSSAQSTAVAGANLPVFLPGQSTPFGDPISLLQPVGPGSSDVGPTRSAARSARATFDTLLPPVDLTQAVDALRTALPDGFQRLGTRLATETSNLRVPIVNDGIQTSIDQLNAFGQAFKVEADALAADGTLTPAEASTAINATFTDLGWSASSVTGPIFLGDGGVTYDLTLRRSLAPIGTTDFDIGLPALELDLGSANVDLSTGLDLDLTIGLDPDDGFYFSTFGNVGGLLTASAQASGFDALGELNQLKVRAVNTPGGEFEAGIGLSIDLLEPSSDDRLTLVELSDAATSDILGINVTSYAPGRPTGVDLDLDLAAGFDNPQQASLDTTLRVDWTIATFAASGSQPPTFAGQPTVRYENVVVDFDTFLRSTLGPTLETIGDVLGPVRPIIEVLAEPIPVLSDLSGGPITLATLAELYGDIELDGFINAADRLFDLIDVADNPANSAIDVGTFEFNLDPSATSLVGVAVGSTPPSQAPVDQVRAVSEALTNFFVEDNEAFGLTFPILNDPSSISNLLLGRDVDLIEFDVPKLQIEFGFDQFYPIIGPIGATFRGNIGASADLTFGLDSAAFLDGNNILDGLFVDDLDASGRDVTEVRLFGSITAGASFNLKVAEAGVDGGIFATVDLNLNDPNNDGKVRLQEIQDNFSLAPVYVFDVSGELTAGLVAFAEVDLFFWERRWERRFAEVTLLDFNLSRPDGSTFNPGDVTPDGTLTLTSSGGLDDPAQDSAARNTSPTAFRYRIFAGENPGDVFIQTRGNLFERNGVRNLRFDGSSGDDSIFVDPDVQLLPGGTIELNGGGGDDTISGGSQPSILSGGPGDDVLTAGPGRVSLFGGTGNDQLTGSRLDDFLDGGPDDDFIDGSLGNDELLGGDGDDLLFGNRGNDTLRGGAGVDELSGDIGNDLLISDAGVVFRAETIFGGAGNDTIVGGQNIEGGSGDDEITASTTGRGATVFGGFGNDIITGTPDADAISGDDSVFGGVGNDVINALDGDDLIITHDGNNTVDAGPGNDSVEGGLNVDVVTGGAGDDFIQLGSGNDTATGNAGLDTITGGAGNDDIDGGTDADVLSGGPLNDLVVGGEGDDTIAGNAGDDTLVGHGGNDRVTGDDTDEGFGGNDSLFGGAGSDILRAGGGNDQLHGNAGIDELFGGDGKDSLFGGTQTDRLDDGRGDDLIRGGTDADLLILDVFDPTANDDFEGFGGNGLAFVNGNIVPDTGNDDSATATDRLVYLGSEGFDDVEVLQVDTPSGTSLQFIYVFQGNGFFLREVAWRALDGTPRFRQVELLLGSGNDVAIIDNSVDTTGVAIPGTSQFVFGIQGGPGDDRIIGSDNAEQLIGGPGSDELFGNGGDDRLWGDDVGGGDRVFDVNRLFGGGGNDDLIGGEGRNLIFAWSRDPLASGTFQPILVDGNVEETGIDRMLGGPADDTFYGAVAPSFIFGNGGNDVIIDTAGEAVSAGTFFADGFADYAQDLDGVWYIAGSNSIKDEIEVTSDVDGVLVNIT